MSNDLNASVKVTFSTEGHQQIRRILDGTTRAAVQGSRARESASARLARTEERDQRKRDADVKASLRRQAAEERRALREREKAEKQHAAAEMAIEQALAAEKKRLADEEVRLAKRVARTKEREAARAARTATREAEKSARAQEAAARRAESDAKEAADRRAGRLMRVGAVGAALGNRAMGYMGAMGIGGRDEQVSNALSFGQNIIRLGGQAGLNRQERGQLQSNILNTSNRTGVNSNDLLAGLNVAQNRFSNLRFFADNLEALAVAANVTQTPMEDMVGAVGEMQRQLGVTAAQVPELIGFMTQASRNGSVEFSDISAEFATTIGQFARVTKLQGMDGARQAVALAEGIGAGGVSGSEAATLTQNLLAKLSSADVQKRMKRAGIRLNDRDGNFVGVDNLVQQFATNRRTQTEAQRQGILGADMQANQAIGILIGQYNTAASRGEANPITELMNSSASEGNRFITETQQELMASPSGVAIQNANRAQNNFVANGDELINAMNAVVGPLSDLTTRFPLLTEAAGTLKDVFVNLAGASAIQSLLAGGGGAAAAAGGAGAAAGGGGLLASLGLVTTAGASAVGAGVVAAGAAGGAVGYGIERLTASDGQYGNGIAGQAGSWWYEFFNGDINAQYARAAGDSGPRQRDAETPSAREHTEAVREQTREIQRQTTVLERAARQGASVGTHTPERPR